jgi:hypothetical protein
VSKLCVPTMPLLELRLTRDAALSLSSHRKSVAPADNKKTGRCDEKKTGCGSKYVDCVMICASLDLFLTAHVFSPKE